MFRTEPLLSAESTEERREEHLLSIDELRECSPDGRGGSPARFSTEMERDRRPLEGGVRWFL